MYIYISINILLYVAAFKRFEYAISTMRDAISPCISYHSMLSMSLSALPERYYTHNASTKLVCRTPVALAAAACRKLWLELKLRPKKVISRTRDPRRNGHAHRVPMPIGIWCAIAMDAPVAHSLAVVVRSVASYACHGSRDADAAQHHRRQSEEWVCAENRRRRTEHRRSLQKEKPGMSSMIIFITSPHSSPIKPMPCSISSMRQRVTRREASVMKRST